MAVTMSKKSPAKRPAVPTKKKAAAKKRAAAPAKAAAKETGAAREKAAAKKPAAKKATARKPTPKKVAAKKKATAKKKAAAKPRRKTETSAFGVSSRISHDSSKFYDSKLYRGAVSAAEAGVEVAADPAVLDRIYCKSSTQMDDIPDGSVHLMVTSPPYNVKKEYDDDLTLEEYRQLLRDVFAETYRKLAPGGRACVNVANIGRKPYIPLHAYIIQDMHALGFLMRGEIIWNKGASAGPSTAWGSWRSASNPVLRDVHEYIMVFSKAEFSRKRPAEKANTITRDDFLENTKSVWTFAPVSAKRIGHPAPYPEELPARLIELYTFEGDVVLDPFNGSGTTCLAAKRRGRRYVGYDLDPEYVQLAEARLAELDQGTLF